MPRGKKCPQKKCNPTCPEPPRCVPGVEPIPVPVKFYITQTYECSRCPGRCDDNVECYTPWELKFKTDCERPKECCKVIKVIEEYVCCDETCSSSSSSSEDCSQAWLSFCDEEPPIPGQVKCGPCGK